MTIKNDERLLMRIYAEEREGHKSLRDLGQDAGIPPKRLEYIAEKWIGKGWWECGVSATLGWLTQTGRRHMQQASE